MVDGKRFKVSGNDHIFLFEGVGPFFRFRDDGLVFVEESDSQQIVFKRFRIFPGRLLNPSEQKQCLAVDGTVSGTGQQRGFGFFDNGNQLRAGRAIIFFCNGQTGQSDIRGTAGIGIEFLKICKSGFGFVHLVGGKIDLPEQRTCALGPLGRKTVEIFHNRGKQGESFGRITFLPQGQRIIIGLWLGHGYGSNIAHRNPCLRRSHFYTDSPCFHPENLAVTPLPVLLQDGILRLAFVGHTCHDQGRQNYDGWGDACFHRANALITFPPQINSFPVNFMINLLRKNQRELMLVVAVLTIVAFIFLYNSGPLDDLATTRNPKIYGQTLTPGAIDRQVKNYQLTLALGQFDLVSKLAGNSEDQASSMSDFVWNLLVLQHQARVLGIEPTDTQVADKIKALPVFQTSNQFDPLKYSAFVSNQLTPRGFTERQLEEVMRDSLRLEKIQGIIESPIAVGDKELRDAARVLQPVKAEFIRFNADEAAKTVTVSPEEIKEFFDRNQSNLNTKETRAVRYVAFELPPGAKPEGRAKVEELQKLADQASKFSDSLANTPFDKAAAAAGQTVRSIPAFDRTGNLPAASQIGGEAAKQIQETVTAIAPAAFLLPAVGKTSDIVQAGDAFYIIELAELNAARPLMLAEASPSIEARLREVKAEQALNVLGETQVKALRTAIASGKTFDDAAKAAGLAVETLDNIAPMGDKLTPDQRRIVSSTLLLKDGEISGFETAPWGGLCVYLQSRGPLADADLAARRAEIQQSLLENKRMLVFNEWLRVCREEAKISVPGGKPQS